jgi:hypothetical protein
VVPNSHLITGCGPRECREMARVQVQQKVQAFAALNVQC